MNKCHVRSTILFLLGCLPLWIIAETAAAQEGSSSPPLSLEQAIRTGLEKNPRMLAARSRLDASAAGITQAQSGLYPRVDFNESFVRTNNPAQAFSLRLNQERITTQDFDPSRLNEPSPINNFASTFSMNMPIYDAGQIRIGVDQARMSYDSAVLTADRVRQEVITAVVAAYTGVLLMQDQLELTRQALETAMANHKIVRSRVQSGLAVKSDLLRSEVRIAELEQERLSARSQVDVARAALNAAMGVDTGHAFQPIPFEEKGSSSPGSLERWLENALKNRPDLREMKVREMTARQELRKAKMSHLPSLYLTGNYELDSEDFDRTGDNYTVGVVLRLNLFNGFATQAKVREALANVQQMKANVNQIELGVGVETRRAFFQAQSAFERISVAQAAVDQAEEALRIVRNRYENGLFTIVNLLDAEVSLQQTKNRYLRSLYDYKLAMAQLNLAAGTAKESVQ